MSLVQTSPQIGGVFVALLPTMALVANGLSYGLRNLRLSASRSAGDANAILSEAVSNVRVIHSFTAEAHTKQKFVPPRSINPCNHVSVGCCSSRLRH